MVKVILGYAAACGIFLALLSLHVFGLLHVESAFWGNFWIGFRYFLTASIPVFVVVASFLVNRKWKQIVEEDFVIQNTTPTSQEFLRSAYIWGYIALSSLLFGVAVNSATVVYSGGIEYLWTSIYFFFFIGIIILVAGLLLFRIAVREAKDHESFAKYPPRLPNLLSILTGEGKAPKGIRNRINFMGDLVGIGWILFAMNVMWLNHPWFDKPHGDMLYLLLFSLNLLAYFLFVIFFAGIPRKRYWGMIFLGVSALLIDSGVHLSYLMLSETFAMKIWIACGLSFWYLLCFTLLGVGGLWVFRKR
jgi:hypothetical protein